jgi:hypothetical protein
MTYVSPCSAHKSFPLGVFGCLLIFHAYVTPMFSTSFGRLHPFQAWRVGPSLKPCSPSLLCLVTNSFQAYLVGTQWACLVSLDVTRGFACLCIFNLISLTHLIYPIVLPFERKTLHEKYTQRHCASVLVIDTYFCLLFECLVHVWSLFRRILLILSSSLRSSFILTFYTTFVLYVFHFDIQQFRSTRLWMSK